MYIFALVLMIKSVWSTNKTKRQFFLVKHLNNNIQESLNKIFSLGIIHCKFNSRTCKLEYIKSNSWLNKYFIN